MSNITNLILCLILFLSPALAQIGVQIPTSGANVPATMVGNPVLGGSIGLRSTSFLPSAGSVHLAAYSYASLPAYAVPGFTGLCVLDGGALLGAFPAFFNGASLEHDLPIPNLPVLQGLPVVGQFAAGGGQYLGNFWSQAWVATIT